MIEKLIKSIFGDPSEKKIKEYSKMVETIKKLEKNYENFDEKDVKAKTAEFKSMFEGLDFKDNNDSLKIKTILNDIKLDAFALVKRACTLLNGQTFTLTDEKVVTWNMIPYDVQLIGGLAIHDGSIAEMKTGEGKTLVATLPAYLNALTGNTVQIVTVNDYLAKRDSEEMGILYNFLGLTVGVITHDQSKEEKKDHYSRDIVYATNNELGFDYLRDNMVIKKEQKVQCPLFFAIIDEVDSILIDEARTPLIISMSDSEPTSKYVKFAQLIKYLENEKDYKIDEKQKTATLTENGIKKVEELLHIENIYVSANYNDLHHIENALKAMTVFKRDKDYIIVNGEVMIVDEHTGRALSGRRYSDGLHQALEAKEGVEIKQESKTMASITFQNYFRMYWKLSGMTGTAKTEEEEFYKVYALETLVIPTNKPIARADRSDLLFKNEKGKFDYVVSLIKELHATEQPILVGTVSVDKSEYLSDRLKLEGVPHTVLNAKQHEMEAEIVAKAGQKGAVTIATNMAGRGTDIKLGEGVVELGGLIIIGTEKHETRRIDNQLRGRAGRQGDPGVTQFLISPYDDIMRIFGGDKLFSVFNSPMFASIPDDEPLAQSGMLTRKVTGVQKQVEGHNFDARKHVLEYDDVMNKHRSIIYSKRNKILNSENIDGDIKNMIIDQLQNIVDAEFTKGNDYNEENKTDLVSKINEFLGTELVNLSDLNDFNNAQEIGKFVSDLAIEEVEKLKSEAQNIEDFYELERRIVLSSIDEIWMRHIDAMSHLREEVAFEGYAQKNPLVVYKERAFNKFRDLINELEYKVVKAMFSVNKISEVDMVNLIDENSLEINDDAVEALLGSFSEKEEKNENPLFINNYVPDINIQSNNSGKTKKIRV